MPVWSVLTNIFVGMEYGFTWNTTLCAIRSLCSSQLFGNFRVAHVLVHPSETLYPLGFLFSNKFGSLFWIKLQNKPCTVIAKRCCPASRWPSNILIIFSSNSGNCESKWPCCVPPVKEKNPFKMCCLYLYFKMPIGENHSYRASRKFVINIINLS